MNVKRIAAVLEWRGLQQSIVNLIRDFVDIRL
nr:MAG TPA: hypothetical protein [Bacteriophage sp.]